ncbi:MAG TPA: S9 family peptidase [Thermoanaerobaculia bacterium]|nr:S9 family peptidase [Thermoanaerobaculia bacterium]
MATLFVFAACTTSQPGRSVSGETGGQPAVSPAASDLTPPVARIEPQPLDIHGHTRVDPYYWLKQREDPDVISYLEAENQYTAAVMAHTADLQEKLYQEIVERIPQTDESVPFRLDGYHYYRRFEEGKEYPIHARREGSLDAPEEILIDVNELAKGSEFFSARPVGVSIESDLFAFASDNVGRRFYTLRIRDLKTGEFLEDEIPNVTGNAAWANDNRTLFYSKQHPDTLRSYQIWRHVIGTSPSEDVLVYQEDDETFGSYVFRTKSKRYLVIGSYQSVSSEYRILEADNPAGEFRVFEPRARGHEYDIDHFGDHFYIRTNLDGASNFKLMKTPVGATTSDHWSEVVAHRDEVFLGNFEIFRELLVLSERKEGLIHLRIMPWDGSAEHDLDFGEPAYLAAFDENPEFDTQVLRFTYTSLTTPWTTYDYDMKSRQKTMLKRERVGGGFDPANYRTERLWARARDGKRIPVSLVYRVGFERNGSAPLLVYGYGSYGSSRDATFSSARLSLLDRGFVYAIAHVRGGQEMGRSWYDDGKLLQKKNTFTDFIDATEFLIDEKYADPGRVFAYGGSAGGLLMGAIMNMRPELWKGVIAAVPFVDVITTMLDPDIPLTTGEYDEWGNPNEKPFYDYILTYSPYDNIEEKAYPNTLVTTGLHDSQVQYWEPAKWVAKLRAMKADRNRLLLKTNMEAGHGGASGRFKQHRETALMYAFVLDLSGIQQ